MTDEMLALARDNQRTSGVGNVEFLRGEIENVPFPTFRGRHHLQLRHQSLADKDRVFAEASAC